MSFRDEEILEQRQALLARQAKEKEQEKMEQEKEESIFDGIIHLYGKEVVFTRREFEEYGISLLMPETFEELDQEIKDAIYPYGRAPKYAFAAEGIPFQITLNRTEHIVPNDGIPKFMGMAKSVMERIGPQAKVFSNDVVRREERNIGVMEIATRGVDGPVFNMQFYISLQEQRIFIGAITCQGKRHDRMVPLMKQIIDSVVIFEDEEKKDGIDHIL